VQIQTDLESSSAYVVDFATVVQVVVVSVSYALTCFTTERRTLPSAAAKNTPKNQKDRGL
jgi:hypothetical protein